MAKTHSFEGWEIGKYKIEVVESGSFVLSESGGDPDWFESRKTLHEAQERARELLKAEAEASRQELCIPTLIFENPRLQTDPISATLTGVNRSTSQPKFKDIKRKGGITAYIRTPKSKALLQELREVIRREVELKAALEEYDVSPSYWRSRVSIEDALKLEKKLERRWTKVQGIEEIEKEYQEKGKENNS